MARPDRTTRAEVHNKLATELVKTIARTCGGPNNDPRDMLVVAESIVVGIILLSMKPGSEEKATQIMMRNVVERAKQIRALARPAEGSA